MTGPDAEETGLDTPSFVFDFQPGTLQFGRGCLTDLDRLLAENNCDAGLVVCGRNVGANDTLMQMVETGLGDRHAGTFDGTTPDKRVAEAIAAADLADQTGADAFVPVGGGSSLDVATVASVLRADGRGLEAVRREVADTGGISLPERKAGLTPLVPVPTTFAGADLSALAGITVEVDDTVVSTGVGDESLMPAGVAYDPAAFETTPPGVLAGSTMNGFDKGIEGIYADTATAVTDATAVRGLRYLRTGFPQLFDGDMNPAADAFGATERIRAAMDRSVAGILLVQYGVSTIDRMKLSVIHAFGHGCRDAFGVQQGVAHAVLAPHVLRAVLKRSNARRAVLAEGLGVSHHEAVDLESELPSVVAAVRDAIGLPARLRDLPETSDEQIEEAVRRTAEDGLLAYGPTDLELSEEDIRAVLEAAW